MCPGSSVAASHTPMRPSRATSASRSARHTASGTITSPSGSFRAMPSSPTSTASSNFQRSCASFRSLMSNAIYVFLERLDADATHDVDEALGVAVAPLEVELDQLLDDVRHFVLRNRRAEHLAERSTVPLRAADRDLVELRPLLVHPEDADVADVVVPAGVHAARDVQIELADVVDVVEIVEAPLDRFRDRDRFRVRERAVIAARARDDVRDRAEVRRGELERLRFLPHGVEIGLLHVRQ